MVDKLDEVRINLKDIPESISKDPYNAVMKWADKNFKIIGQRAFSVLALMPQSVFMPKLKSNGRDLNMGISCLFLAPPSTGKSALAGVFSELCYNPYKFKQISSAEIQTELEHEENPTIIIDDASITMQDPELMKIIEGIIEEGVVSKRTKRERLDYSLRANAYMAGIPTDLTSYLASGMLSRITPIIIIPKKEEQDQIGDSIADSIGKDDNKEYTLRDISNYYKFLFQCSQGMQDYNVIGYKISLEATESIKTAWKVIRRGKDFTEAEGYNRELIAGFKYLCSSAYLNLPNRVITDGLLEPNKDDLNIAVYLLQEELKTKREIIKHGKIAEKFKEYDSFVNFVRTQKPEVLEKIRNLNLKLPLLKAMMQKT